MATHALGNGHADFPPSGLWILKEPMNWCQPLLVIIVGSHNGPHSQKAGRDQKKFKKAVYSSMVGGRFNMQGSSGGLPWAVEGRLNLEISAPACLPET